MEALAPWTKASLEERKNLAREGISKLQHGGLITDNEASTLQSHLSFFHENPTLERGEAVQSFNLLLEKGRSITASPVMIALNEISIDSVARFGAGEAAVDLSGGIFGGVVGGVLGAGLGGAALSYAASTIDPV